MKFASIVIPAPNERGNIEAAVRRIPRFVEPLEIFVEGHSKCPSENILNPLNRL